MYYKENIHHLSEEFMALLASYLKMETSTEENQVVEEWLQQKPEHAAILLNVNKLISNEVQENLAIDIDEAWKKFEEHANIQPKAVIVRGRFTKQKFWLAAACIAFVCMIAVLYKFIITDKSNFYKGVVSVKLKDGTKIQLEEHATLLLDGAYNKKNREVSLTGNGFFEVAKDPAKPFIIHMSKRTLTVLGTAFKINQDTDSNYLNIKVTEGVVKVDDSLSKGTYKLIAGQELSLTNTKSKINVITAFGQLRFENVSFINILNTLEKLYKIKFINNVQTLNQVSYTVDLSSEPLDKALQTLSTLTGITIEKKNDSLYVVK